VKTVKDQEVIVPVGKSRRITIKIFGII